VHSRTYPAGRLRPSSGRRTVTLVRQLKECEASLRALEVAFPSLRQGPRSIYPTQEEQQYASLREQERQLKLELVRRGDFSATQARSAPRDSKREDVASAHGASATPVEAARTLSQTRQASVRPVLEEKGMTRSEWATKVGVDPSVVYDYLQGKSRPRAESRKALAEAIGLKASELPD
jgi:ribosome-binding protein aMBF1 (putative translation factor)